MSQGTVDILNNTFAVDTPYTVGLFVTESYRTSHFNISDNRIFNFHGGIFLRNSDHALIANNRFSHVSISNIYTIGSYHSLFDRNVILFPGNNNLGDGIDIIDSDNITLSGNYIASGSCYSVMILRGKDIMIAHNRIIGGITYAISIKSSIGINSHHDKHLVRLLANNKEKTNVYNQDITVINNYLAQNRYGLSAINVKGLKVQDNVFIQYFDNNISRKFWTNNDILLQEVSDITWNNNLYKEAFTQKSSGNNDQASRFVIFPLHGGVSL